jgi:hypothetical protein
MAFSQLANHERDGGFMEVAVEHDLLGFEALRADPLEYHLVQVWSVGLQMSGLDFPWKVRFISSISFRRRTARSRRP